MPTDRTHPRERGQALVEFALVLPILATLILGVIQFGIVFHDYLALADAVRTGARQASVTHDPGAASNAVYNSASELKASDLNVSVASSSATWQTGTDVTVTATYPYDISILGVVVKSGRLNAKTTDRVE
jgi:Flp pilus assembly protein TadG